MDYRALSRHCINDEAQWIRDELSDAERSGESVDLLWQEGKLFHFACMSSSPEVLNILLKYYEDHNLKGESDSYEYLSAKKKLMDVVQDILYSHITPSEEVMKVLQPYTYPEDKDGDSMVGVEDIPDSYDCDEEVPQGEAVRQNFVNEGEGLSDHASTDYHSDAIPKSPGVDGSEDGHVGNIDLNTNTPLIGHDPSPTDL